MPLRRTSSTSSPEPSAVPVYILNTRPVLNFLGSDCFDLLGAALEGAICIGPTVLREVRDHALWTKRDLERQARLVPESLDGDEVTYTENLGRWSARLNPPLVRRLTSLAYEELDDSRRLMQRGRLDPGESEVLAIARVRGWVAVIDEFAGHCQAELDSIPHESTLSLLVRAVREGRIGEGTATNLWGRMLRWWDYAPQRPLGEYIAGRPIWPPCYGWR